jgi:hypothetical protein
MVLWFLGYPNQPLDRIDQALPLAQTLVHPYSVAAALNRAACLGQFCQENHATHVQGVRLNQAIFASEKVILSRWGVQGGQKCPCKDSNVAAIMLTTPCRVSGGPSALTLCAKILFQLVSPPWHMGWDTVLFAGKYPVFT